MIFTPENINSMDKYSIHIVNRINKIQRYTIAIYILSSCISALTILMLATLISIPFNDLLTSSYVIKLSYSVSTVLLLIYLTVRFNYSKIHPVTNKQTLALKLEKKFPRLNTSLISSIQFINNHELLSSKTFSTHMVLSLLKETCDKISNLKTFSILDKKFLIYVFSGFIFTSIICAVQYNYNPTLFINNIKAYTEPFNTRTNDLPVNTNLQSTIPTLSDITLKYTYPFYSGLKPETILNTNGDIRALKGSFVDFSAISNHPVQSADITFNKNIHTPLTITDGKLLNGEIQLFEDGLYHIALKINNEPLHTNTESHTITIIEDQFPEISLLNMESNSIVSEKGFLNMEYSCNDDFGVKYISLNYNINNLNDTIITLKTFNNNKLKFKDSYNWDLNTLNLKPGDKMDYYLEVKDNDTVSGPKSSTTKIHHIEILDDDKNHKDAIDSQATLLNKMKELLSDETANHNKVLNIMNSDINQFATKTSLISAREAIYKKSRHLLPFFDKTINMMQNDVSANSSIMYIINNLKETFDRITRKEISTFRLNVSHYMKDEDFNSFLSSLETSYTPVIKFLEKSILLLEKLLERQTLNEFLKDSEYIDQYKERLDSLLNQMKNDLNAKTHENLINELNKISKITKQIMEELSDLPEKLSDNLKDSDSKDMQDELQKLADLIQGNDLESATNSAKKTLDLLKDMLESIKAAAAQSASNAFSEFLESINNLIKQLEDTENEEKDLELETKTLKKKIDKRTEESTNGLLETLFVNQKERLKTIISNNSKTDITFKQIAKNSSSPNHPPLPEFNSQYPFIENEINKMKEDYKFLSEMFNEKDINESLKLAKGIQQSLSRLYSRVTKLEITVNPQLRDKIATTRKSISSSTGLNNQIVEDLDSFFRMAKQEKITNQTAGEGLMIKEFSNTQSLIHGKTTNIQSDINELQKETSIIGNEIKESLNKASNHMQSAKNKLDRDSLNDAIVEERNALYNLQQTIGSLNKVKEMVTTGLSGNGMKVPFFKPGFPGGQQGSNGIYGLSVEKVEIPSEHSYKVPKEFREDILKEMKGNFPVKYEPLNRDYFKELLQ